MAEQRSTKTSSAAWQDAVSTWEKSVNGMANATMANDEFSGVLNQAMKLTLLMQQSLGNVMAVYLSALNLPTKTEVAGLGERLAVLEQRMDRMTTLLERIAAGSSHASAGAADADATRATSASGVGGSGKPMPPRTKRPPEKKKAGKK